MKYHDSTYLLPSHHYDNAKAVENGLLGTALLDATILDRIETHPHDWHQSDFGRAFALLADLRTAGKPIHDMKLIVSELSKANLLNAIGGHANIAKLANDAVPSSAEWYASEIRRCAQLRRTAETLAKGIEDCQATKADGNEIIERTIADLQAVQHVNHDDTADLSEVLDSELIAIEETIAKGQVLGLPTGFPALDSLTGGFFPGELTILASRPSIGKSAFALELAYRLASRGRSSLLVSLEMGRESIAHRLLGRETGIPCRRIQKGDLDKHEFDRLRQARLALRGLPIRIMDGSTATVAKISARARVQIAQQGMDLLIIDYLGLLDAQDRRLSIYERVTAISRECKTLARDLYRPVLLLAQLKRQGENRQGEKDARPTLAMLRDSGAIEQDADLVWFLYREQRDSRETELIVAKQRQGGVGTLDFEFDGGRMSFDEKHFG